MAQETLSVHLEENKAFFQNRFQNAMDLIVREVELSGRKAALFAIDGLINKETIALCIVEPLLREEAYPSDPKGMMDHMEHQVLSAAELKRENRMPQLLTLLMSWRE